MTEDWSRWVPLSENKIKGNYRIQKASEIDDGSFVIMMDSDKGEHSIRVTLGCEYWSYRVTDEGYCWGIAKQLSEKYGDVFYINWSFFEIKNSKYIKEIS